MGAYWGTLGLLAIVYLIILTLKYYVLNLSILAASKSIHEDMIQAMVRSPGSYFDSTPSGTLVNKFSNDLKVIDNLMIFCFINVLEGPAIFFIAVVNLCQINILMILPTIVVVFLATWLFLYSRSAIIKCK